LGETSDDRDINIQFSGSDWDDRIEAIEAIKERLC